MSVGRDPTITTALVSELIATQFPSWSTLSVQPVRPGGWDNRTFRLGDDLLVRLPSASRYAAQVEKEQRWLPRLAPHLSLPIPIPVAMGGPGCGYRFGWSVYRWLEGDPATPLRMGDPCRFAGVLAGFLESLQGIDTAGGPPPGPHNFYRGGPLSTYDEETRRTLRRLGGVVDVEAATQVWDGALEAKWGGAPVWLHGDVAASNLLLAEGRLRAVIDFGGLAVGDPACDLAIAWTLLSGESRHAFREALAVDDPTWLRGRGWALWKSLITLADFRGRLAPDEYTAMEGSRAGQVVASLIDDAWGRGNGGCGGEFGQSPELGTRKGEGSGAL